MFGDEFKKALAIVGIGIMNFVHGIFHIIQFVQSIIMSSADTHEHTGLFEGPVWSVVWVIIGFTSLWIGVKDFKHHKKCND